MNLHPLFLCVLVLCAAGPAWGQAEEEVPEPYRSLPQALRNRKDQFPVMPVGDGKSAPKFFKLDLAEKAFAVGEREQFAAFMIRTPATPRQDMVWCFRTPEEWRNWYIVPMEGSMKGFRNWFNADRVYREFPGSAGPPVALQSLEAASLKPDTEYFIWFHAEGAKPPPGTLSAAIVFTGTGQGKRGWENESMEKALGLHDGAAAEQVAFLKSRGGAIVLDGRLFDKDYGEERISHVLFDIRNTKTFRGGFYIAMATDCPVCKTKPSFAEIEKQHGKPDLVMTGAERLYFGEKLNEDEKKDTIAYYDHFGFVFKGGDPARIVQRVETSGFSAAHPDPAPQGLTYSDVLVAKAQMRLFYKDGKEIARIGNWGEHGAKLLSGELPQAEYVRLLPDQSREVMAYSGDGRWSYRMYYPGGELERETAVERHSWNGKLKDFYPNGGRRAEVTYKDGLLEGELLQWDENGKALEKRYFTRGQESRPPQ